MRHAFAIFLRLRKEILTRIDRLRDRREYRGRSLVAADYDFIAADSKFNQLLEPFRRFRHVDKNFGLLPVFRTPS